MYATHVVNVRRTITIFALLPVFFAFSSCNKNSGKRSLHNYVATSVPYTVQSHGLHHDELSMASALSEKADLNLVAHDNPTQDMLDCVNENHCTNNITISEHSPIEGTFKPFSQDELNKFLQKYETKEQLQGQETTNKIANYYSVANSNNIETSSPVSDSDKSKAWNLISYHQHHQPLHTQHHNTYSGSNNNNNNNNNKNPYDDRMGWVTLEPIAWSSSQVQKWEPNTKPSWPIPTGSGPWGSPSQYQQQSNYGGYSDRPYKKPTYQYQSKPWNSKPQFSNYFGNQEIITDGQPGHFPNDRPQPSNQATGSYKPWLEHTQTLSYIDSGNRPATHIVYQGIGTGTPPHPHIPERPLSQSSSDGDGHWVLLSSTKGYSVPQRQRSFGRSLKTDEDAALPAGQPKEIKFEKRARPLSARRSINLTVLPKKGLTVTSHNGMIEREATHQTVDESHREHLARMLRFGNATQKEPPAISILSR